MHNVAPVTDLAGRHRALRLAFASGVVSLVAAFAAVGSTIPLFNIYRAEDGFTNAGISMTVVAYSAATLTTLLVLGRLSNHLGRRPISVASLVLLLLGCVLLLNVHDIGILIAGRLLMGLGAGLASSSITSYTVDAAPARPAWLASVASSQTIMLGLAVGAIASGALVQFGPWPREHIFLVVIALLLASLALIVVSPETVTRMPGAWRSLRPPGLRAGPGQGSPPGRGRGVIRDLGGRCLLPSVRAGGGRRATSRQQPAHRRTGVRRLHGRQRSRRCLRRPVHQRQRKASA